MLLSGKSNSSTCLSLYTLEQGQPQVHPPTPEYILEPVACFAATWKLGKLFAKDKQGAGLDNWNHFIVASQN
ncbi:MAG: hypothetical protein CL912_19505 [Deltaproteobacteria bacterium]|jgi:hypothetical protein|nr:hypothetical protein [Deltaproteobacteria bacterium]|tara:strand:- start:974 stop:1189 length:216 start_codon:yes stop_codon:yes gene_type:complete